MAKNKAFFKNQLVFLITFTKACPIPIQSNMRWWWIEIEEIPKYKLYGNIEYLSKTTFWYHRNDSKTNPCVVLFSHCPINDSLTIYTLPFTLQLCYKSLGILQRVTKSQKVHISSHDELQNLHNINFTWRRSRGILRERVEKQEFPHSPVTFFKTIKNPFLGFESRHTILNEELRGYWASYTEKHCGHSCYDKNF